jgi:membrane protease YdiL (CAAX protease family)
MVRRDPAARAAARDALAPVQEYFPRTAGEQRLFQGVAFAAGTGEEIYYRGFLLWYLSAYVSVVPAVLLSSALFGIAHVMHGAQATIRSTAMGVVLAVLYLVSGSLWASILLHTAVDLSSGQTGVAAFSEDGRVVA